MILIALAAAAAVSASSLGIDPKASVPLAPVAADHAPGSCHVRIAANGMQLPDPACTPGAVNPTVTGDVLRNPAFRTGMIRGDLTTEAQKKRVYVWYGITPPADNKGADQVCEIDHLVSLRLGGSDAMENLWPQCEPGLSRAKPVGQREFKVKDSHAEESLAERIKAGDDLSTIQHEIASDWTQFIAPDAKAEAYVSGAPQ